MSKKYIVLFGGVLATALILAVVYPMPFRPTGTSPLNACLNNLRRIDGATKEWALVNHKGTNAIPTWTDIDPYLLKYGKLPNVLQVEDTRLGRWRAAPRALAQDMS